MSDELEKQETAILEFLDSAGNILNPPRKPTEEEAQVEVSALAYAEIERRQWCVGMALQAYNIEVSESTFTRLSDKIYEYVYGKRT